jgi:hypothetical protein
VIEVPSHLLADTFAIFRDCGGARRECVVYWIGSTEDAGVVDELVHPRHTSGQGGYQIDDAWLTRFWFDLARWHKSVRVQVHTHPRAASHSPTDDNWALIHTPGFLSLVIPNFAQGPISVDGAYLAERTPTGWRSVAIGSRFHIRLEDGV